MQAQGKLVQAVVPRETGHELVGVTAVEGKQLDSFPQQVYICGGTGDYEGLLYLTHLPVSRIDGIGALQ